MLAEEYERQLQEEEERKVRRALEAATLETATNESTSPRESTVLDSIVAEFQYEEPPAPTTTDTSTVSEVDATATKISNADASEFQDIVDDNTGFSNANDETSGTKYLFNTPLTFH